MRAHYYRQRGRGRLGQVALSWHHLSGGTARSRKGSLLFSTSKLRYEQKQTAPTTPRRITWVSQRFADQYSAHGLFPCSLEGFRPPALTTADAASEHRQVVRNKVQHLVPVKALHLARFEISEHMLQFDRGIVQLSKGC